MNADNYITDNRTTTSESTPERIAIASKHFIMILIIGIIFGLFSVMMKLYWIAAAVGVGLLLSLIAWQFDAALVIYVLIAFMPFGQTPDIATGGSGVGKSLCISEIMLGFLLVAWFAKYLLNALPKNRISSGFYFPLALYLGYCCINVWNSYLFWDSHVNRQYQYPTVNVVELGLHFLSVGAFVMIATSISNKKWLRWVTIAVIAVGVYNCINDMCGGVFRITPMWAVLLTFLPAGYAIAIAVDSKYSIFIRCICAIFVTLTLACVFVKDISWVSGWLGLFIALAVVLFIKNKRLFIICALVFCVFILCGRSFLHKNVVQDSENGGDFDRFSLMLGSFKYATTFPLGVGLGNYRTYNSFYYGDRWGTTSYTSAHGTYSQHLSEMGFPGLMLFLAVLISGFRWMLSNYRKMPSGLSKTYLLAAIGQMAGIGVSAIIGDYIIPSYHNGGIGTFSTTVYSWLIWGLAIAHVRISRDETNGSVDSYR